MKKGQANILFIGGGNMAQALIVGLVQNNYDPRQIFVADRHAEKCKYLQDTYRIEAATDVQNFLLKADVVVLEIKPQGAKESCLTLQKHLPEQALIISIMAGISFNSLDAWLGGTRALVRAMPNTPALIQAGATGLCANTKVTQAQKNQVEAIFHAIGITAWVEQETDINTITALSGSGPAYYFYFMEIMQKAAEHMGIAPEVAKTFAVQTAYGAAQLALSSKEAVATLRAQVTSKGGATEAALKVMQEKNLSAILETAMQAAYDKSMEFSQRFN
jgi:pyrroline-5-carboxylate reductase